MNIQFLYFDGCPGAETAYARLEEVVENLVPGTPIHREEVSSEDAAQELGFHGSPSIHIDGVDLEFDPSRLSCMSCRLYDNEGAPPKWLIEAGVLKALGQRGVLFLCVANSARSQIAEGIARMLAPADVRIQSAGSRPTGVRPEAARVLSELGIDMSKHRSKHVADIDPSTVDTVITLCAEEECPLFLGKAHRLHWDMPDPAAIEGGEELRFEAFRKVRDELRRRLDAVFGRQIRR